ncbi:MAG: DinB family protein [Candidatus Dormibacteraeota bacterium]|nr:DinB family protein [Candidatus Dormibacteraeota bacterium]
MPDSSPIAPNYEGWAVYHQRLVDAVAPLNAAQLDLQAAPHLWTIRTLVCHVIAARVWWFHSWMGEGGAELDEMVDWDEGESARTREASELVSGLKVTWSLIDGCLRRWTESDLGASFRRPIPRPNGELPVQSRRWIIWHVLEHDIHHGGEISFSLGMHGLTGLDL